MEGAVKLSSWLHVTFLQLIVTGEYLKMLFTTGALHSSVWVRATLFTPCLALPFFF